MNQLIKFGSHDIELDGTGMLWFPQYRILCASDIHMEKSTFFQRFGTFLPPYDTLNDLNRLYGKIEYYRPDIFIALGDSFHDVEAYERMQMEEKNLLKNLVGSVKNWIWVKGNHDPAIADVPGNYCDEYIHEDIYFRHIAECDFSGLEISGHFHPKMSVWLKGQNISGPCFVHNQKKIIMPSFGSFTGGLFIHSPEIRKHVPEHDRQVHLISQGRIFKISEQN